MRAPVLLPLLLMTACLPVDAIDQEAEECEMAMLPKIIAKAQALPSDDVLRAKNLEIEHWFEGGEQRLLRIQAQVQGDWKETEVQPVDEATFGLFLREDAVGFPARAETRTKELCAFAEANRVKYQKWSYGAPGLADHVSQSPPTNIVQEVAPE